ncbi:AraC family transcriptional regulator [Pseudomonas sp. AOB-7]|uniref:helix-turn-helix domain-containing protein n=1 Tax=Pseudomonas sp. AOB-7 TaxID=2482750 RepID=UPI000EFCD7D5|nr:AraC family transcriptional regulator [Pseudomonas sp. AOB-7]RMH84694.1 AraC family transcriptional regulator [Pseudomonas sp. AOB-7]
MGSLGETQGITPCLAKALDNAQTLARIAELLADAGAALQQDTLRAYVYLDQAMELLRQANGGSESDLRHAAGLNRWQTRRLDEYISRHLDTPIRTCHLAAQLNLSSSHFSHVFKQTFGITPLAYVARKRIEAARAMMLATDQPLTQIAHAHGFCDQSHFTRTFRRETGMSPLLWRQRCAAKTQATTER